MSGLAAALWLIGLFAAAPAFRTKGPYGFADRLRDTLILGAAIPLFLGALHLLYPVACWCALLACVAVAYRRQHRAARAPQEASHARPLPYVLIGALVAVAWPQLTRPLLDGDSLSYHLPNAASWVQAHSLWTAVTRYWWYPPASELFATGLYTVGTPFALPWSGVGALALLGFRINAWARETGASAPLADALAAATVTTFPLAIQGATLQNDVWLAAFWLETLWTLRATHAATAMRAAALAALIKPQGWLLAGIALAAERAPIRVWCAAGAALGAWLLRDVLLWRTASGAPSSTTFAAIAASTVLAHGVPALALFVRVAVQTSPFAALAFVAALLGPLVGGDRRAGWAACAAALLFLVLPFGYATSVAQLATGASLRFAAPAIALGALLLVPAARRISTAATALALASTLFGIWSIASVFWNDGSTHVALVVAALAAAAAAASRWRPPAWGWAIAIALSVVATSHIAARHPVDYYSDALRVDSATPGIYRWIASERPRTLGGWGLRLGVVNVLSPATRTRDLPDDAACAQARTNGVLLAAVAESDRDAALNADRIARARACGRALYADATGVIADPVRP